MTHILVVDDKEENRYYLEALLSANGFTVGAAQHGVEALALARETVPDLIISDLLMPVMDGYTLLRQWKADERLKQVPFVVYTATYTDADDERLAREMGADAFILKPTEPEDFLTRIGDALAREAVTPRSAAVVEPSSEEARLALYSEVLVRKLEDKSLQLHVSNQALVHANQQLAQDSARQTATEESLRESERRLTLATQAGGLGVWDWDVVANRMVWDTQMYALYGIREEDFTGAVDAWQQGLHAEDRPRAEADLAAALAGTRDFITEFRVRWPSGEIRDIEAHGLVLRAPDGAPLRMIGINRDFTARKRAERRVAEQAALLDQASSAFIVRDFEHRVLLWSRGAERLFGWTAAEAVGQSVQVLLRTDPTVFAGALEAVLRDGEWNGEPDKFTKAGTRLTLESRWSLLRDERGQATSILEVDIDITDRKRLEQQVLRAQRMESIGTLAGGVAHDLNNALAPIIMSVELLKMTFPDAESQELITTIGSSAQHGADMVRQLLSFARGIQGQRVEVQVRHLVEEIEKIVRDTFLKDVSVRATVAPDLWTMVGDATQIHQVLMNLCVNARDAMPQGGTLTITAENIMLDAQFAGSSHDVTPGPYVVLKVEDTGEGMPPEIVEKIFDPFFTTKEVGKGTGLGLSTSLGIVKSHGGFMRVYSEPGSGTKFTVFLPANPEAGGTAPPTVAEKPVGHGELILVVDDEASIRQITRQTLEAFGYRVLVATDGANAVVQYATRGADIAVVLLDMMMPIMDGSATIRVLRNLNPAVRIIAVSGLYSHERAAQAEALGIDEFLPKPFTADTLLTALRQCLDAPAPA